MMVIKNKINPDRVVILSDIHFPYNDKVLTELALSLIEDIQPKEVVINGDGCDFNSISNHINYEKHFPTILEELELLNSYISEIKERAPNTKTVYIGCNHISLRLEKFIAENPHFDGFFNPDILIKTDEYVPYNVPYFPLNNKKVGIIHGFSSNKYCAGAYADKYNHDLITGHSHTVQMYSSYNNRKYYCIGAMCKSNMKYLKKRPTRLIQSFAVLEFYNDKDYNLIHIEKMKDRIYYNNVVYIYDKEHKED